MSFVMCCLCVTAALDTIHEVDSAGVTSDQWVNVSVALTHLLTHDYINRFLRRRSTLVWHSRDLKWTATWTERLLWTSCMPTSTISTWMIISKQCVWLSDWVSDLVWFNDSYSAEHILHYSLLIFIPHYSFLIPHNTREYFLTTAYSIFFWCSIGLDLIWYVVALHHRIPVLSSLILLYLAVI
jgi:hypothetical protein